MKTSCGFWGGKQIKLDRLQIVGTDKVVGANVVGQWKGAPVDSRTVWVNRQIDMRPVCRGAHPWSKLCLSTDPHLCRRADVGTLAAVKYSPTYHLPQLALKVINVTMCNC
jgi:hypothetical protein